jgi:hypothetical protein
VLTPIRTSSSLSAIQTSTATAVMVQTRSVTARLAGHGLGGPLPRKKKIVKPNKKLMSSGKEKSRQLTSFHCFEKLPAELRVLIWNLTVVPRVVDIKFDIDRGFYTLALTPIALRACPDSRSAIIHAYYPCFGTFLHQPRIMFNYSIDTIYFRANMQNEIMLLFSNLKQQEASCLQRIGIDEDINTDWYDGGDLEVDAFEVLGSVVPKLPALKAVQLVANVAHRVHPDFSEGFGAVRFYESWPEDIMEEHIDYVQFTRGMCSCGECHHEFSDDDFDERGCPCGDHDLADLLDPDLHGRTGSFGGSVYKGIQLSAIWGFRPTLERRTAQF